MGYLIHSGIGVCQFALPFGTGITRCKSVGAYLDIYNGETRHLVQYCKIPTMLYST